MKIAFIGAGGIAGNYRNSLKKLNRPIAAICDLNADRANDKNDYLFDRPDA